MSNNEIKKAAKAAGLPFTKIEPILSALVMTGFLELDEDKGKKLYYKSPLFEEPVAKIKWGDLIGETKKFMAKNWHTIASEYIERYCSDIEIVDPLTGNSFKLGKGAERAVDIESDAFKPFKTYKDTKFKDFDTFMLNAEGDYNEKEIETIKSYYTKG